MLRTSKEYNLGLNLFDAPEINNDFFVGREVYFEEMENILLPHNPRHSTRNSLVLGGMGGIGKTQLAITYAKRYYSCYSSIFWLNAKNEISLQSSLQSLAKLVLGPDVANGLEVDQLWDHVSHWLSKQDNKQWLLIFDNYDDPEQYSLTKYYPSATHGSIIITTRQPELVNGANISVKSLESVKDGLRILATRSGREQTESGKLTL